MEEPTQRPPGVGSLPPCSPAHPSSTPPSRMAAFVRRLVLDGRNPRAMQAGVETDQKILAPAPKHRRSTRLFTEGRSNPLPAFEKSTSGRSNPLQTVFEIDLRRFDRLQTIFKIDPGRCDPP